ncbi:hypothetical protein [Reyranella massiliensis]|uniref:hypothetical protein n=1 Tax=Reyranella massiliensis TaxID=445220 RepID=UPI0002EF122A|nr:hypothetical protein [Reyranella massiliensis]
MIGALLASNPLASTLGIVAAVSTIGLGVQTYRVSLWQTQAAKHEAATAKAVSDCELFKREQATKVAEAERDAARRSEQEARRLLTDIREITSKGEQVREVIRYVQGNAACDNDPRINAIVDGVSDILGPERRPGAAPATALGRAASALPRTDAAGPR